MLLLLRNLGSCSCMFMLLKHILLTHGCGSENVFGPHTVSVLVYFYCFFSCFLSLLVFFACVDVCFYSSHWHVNSLPFSCFHYPSFSRLDGLAHKTLKKQTTPNWWGASAAPTVIGKPYVLCLHFFILNYPNTFNSSENIAPLLFPLMRPYVLCCRKSTYKTQSPLFFSV